MRRAVAVVGSLLTLLVLNAAAAFYLAASAEAFWPVIGSAASPITLIRPPALNCASVAGNPAEWSIECMPPYGTAIAAVLTTPLFCWVLWRKPRRFVLAAAVSGSIYGLVVTVAGSVVGASLLALFRGAPSDPWLSRALSAIVGGTIAGAVATMFALPHVVIGGFLLGLINIGILRELNDNP